MHVFLPNMDMYRIVFAVKFPFQWYIVCWRKPFLSKNYPGGGGVPRATSAFYSVKLCNMFHILIVWNFFGHPFRSHWESFRENLLIKSRNQTMFEKFKLNRNLQTIPFKMIHNMSMLRHRFSNERSGGGGGGEGALSHLPLLFSKIVY